MSKFVDRRKIQPHFFCLE